ncbi:MAG TPA: tetratricopeptide repeat protein [Pyrinomonadaceae bacterium]|jgi:tetratricopeptide (TPR) repeat protein
MVSANPLPRRAGARRLNLLAAAAAAALFACAPARAQQQPANNAEDAYRSILEHRMEMTKRSVDETRRRRFEEGKSDSAFPSDAGGRDGAPAVVRAVPPEEKKALAHNERGLALFSKGKVEQAAAEYEEAIRACPALAAAHNNLGSARFAAGRFAEAAAAFARAAALDPDYGQAHFNLALAYVKLGREREADASLVAAARAYIKSGEAHLRAGRLRAAEESFRAVLRVDPEYAPALLRLGLVCNAGRRYEEGAALLRRVAERRPADPDAHEALAESLYGQRKYEEAATAADRALKLSPDAPFSHYLAGLSRAALGQRDAALRHLSRLQQLGAPDFAQLLSDFIEKKAPAKQ